MSELDFDKYIKEQLYNAEEPVSPAVWKKVKAGMGTSRRVPFWVWAGGFSATVAAAAAAGFLFLAPQKPSPVSPIHSNPIISFIQTPATGALHGAPVAKRTFTVLTEVEEQPRNNERMAVTAIPSAQPGGNVQLSARKQVLRPRKRPVTPVEFLPEAPQTHHRFGSLSLLAFGDVQGNQRDRVKPSAFPQRFSAPPVNDGISETPETHFHLPFSIGIGVKYNVTPHWSVGTGIRYTNLGRTFVGSYVSTADGISAKDRDIDNHQHWLGIPLNIYYDFLKDGRWRVHAFAGGSVEFLVDNRFLIHYSPNDLVYHQKGLHPQWSVSGGLGAEYRLTPWLGIYLDPSFRYYFRTDRQPRSIRTIQPLRFDLEAGVRFSF